MTERSIQTPDGVTLALSDEGEGPAVVLLHGVTASRRYVVMGSRALQRGGHRVVAYDARGHGGSSPAPSPGAYTYRHLYGDLAAVLDALEIERVVLAGVSMGAHTCLHFALRAARAGGGRRGDHAGVRPGRVPVAASGWRTGMS